MVAKNCVFFGEGSGEISLLGGKGYGLHEMVRDGLPVPLGFTLTTDAYRGWAENRVLPAILEEEIRSGLHELEKRTKLSFDADASPLLVSVRSGAAQSMPGMMNTILNVGATDRSIAALAESSCPDFAYETYRTFMHMFMETVFEEKIDFEELARVRVPDGLLIAKNTLRIRQQLERIPTDPYKQVLLAVDGVFRSWDTDRAKEYRKGQNIPDDLGTAVNIQKMVFGNKNEQSGTAVVFSSSPKSGTRRITGEFLSGAQGEAIVSGKITPEPLEQLARKNPHIYARIRGLAKRLEQKRGAILDIEVTWEDGNLFVLQRRDANVTPTAKISFAVDEYDKRRFSLEDTILQIDINDYCALTKREILDVSDKVSPLTQGNSILQGTLTGRLAFNEADIQALQDTGKIIYCREEATPYDIQGIKNSDAILTTAGGAYSHAALVAISLKKLCVVGCTNGQINGSSIMFGDTVLKKGDYVTIDGHTGKVYAGKIRTREGRESPLVHRVGELAKMILGDSPKSYDIQCVQDLDTIIDQIHPVIYSIDFDCLESSGVLHGENIPKKQMVQRVEQRAQETYDTLKTRLCTIPLLTVCGDFDQLFADAGVRSSRLHTAYVKACAKRAKEENTSLRFVPKTSSIFSYMLWRMRGIRVPDIPKDLVLIQPWAREESYLRTAQEVVR